MEPRCFAVLYSLEGLATTPAGVEAFEWLAKVAEYPADVAGETALEAGDGLRRAYFALTRADRAEVLAGLRDAAAGR